MKSILDKSFKYVPAACTDIRETFKRVRREQQRKKSNVQPIKPHIKARIA